VDRTYWHKQTPDKPLFPDLLWSRPENKSLAGKLLIVGGSAHGFAAVGKAYDEAGKAGIGTARALLPDSLQKTLDKVFAAGEYAPSTPSGSFARQALAELLDASQWADGVLLAGDFGRNSETAVLLESFLKEYKGLLTLAGDSLDYFLDKTPLNRPETLIVPTFVQLQKLASGASVAITSKLDFLHLVDALHELTDKNQLACVLDHENTVFVAAKGQVSTTKGLSDTSDTKLAAHTSVWWLQSPSKTFEALTTSPLSV
jgi:NAD(P)H-hydrate repair Nnr-like enzyme with NAD(P)H-hydrate dehydratase domain